MKIRIFQKAYNTIKGQNFHEEPSTSSDYFLNLSETYLTIFEMQNKFPKKN